MAELWQEWERNIYGPREESSIRRRNRGKEGKRGSVGEKEKGREGDNKGRKGWRGNGRKTWANVPSTHSLSPIFPSPILLSPPPSDSLLCLCYCTTCCILLLLPGCFFCARHQSWPCKEENQEERTEREANKAIHMIRAHLVNVSQPFTDLPCSLLN
ncbi:hypothetical protein IE53DRAFT_45955 [Violaceomyces palustris]|uniref:Uncharacterized protein n=1 Tax=Violaceomyces palustris TaxID=1673888 RepID=A0ACD0P0I1_9BASI|nr:hypothetical protein IE53DRAFT_45955 [Violaceomyces palustris]